MSSAANLSRNDQTFLLALARKTLENLRPEGVNIPDEKLLLQDEIPPLLLEDRGVFVTLRASACLRGCLGYVEPVMALYRAVIENAVNAARRDPRFPSVTLKEVPDLDIEISVMAPPHPIENIEEIQVGRDGLILSRGAHRGLLLPQVASENNWDRETFLEQTCRKASLAKDDWRRDDAKIEIFSADVFSE